jgi:hypothetical protein
VEKLKKKGALLNEKKRVCPKDCSKYGEEKDKPSEGSECYMKFLSNS